MLILQKKYGHAGWFRIKGYLENDSGIYLGPTAIKKIMALNRRIHLAPQRPRLEPTEREVREGRLKAGTRLSTPSLICGISMPNRKAFNFTPAFYWKGFHAPFWPVR